MQVGKQYQQFLRRARALHSAGEAAAISNIIFEWITGFNRSALLRQEDMLLSAPQCAQLEDAAQKMETLTPVQYITGRAWFCNNWFKVSPGVLIPRPETEELVHIALDLIKANDYKSVLDIGTGSGCIPISIKEKQQRNDVTAIDISEAALAIARKNAFDLQTPVRFLQMNFLEKQQWENLGVFDLIISNPPYIPEADKKILEKNVVEFEPAEALFVPDEQPLIFYERIAAFGKGHLSAGGKILVELHDPLAESLLALFTAENYAAAIHLDMFEKRRMLSATLYR